MNPTLQSLQALGVRELSVKNQEATAVNPFNVIHATYDWELFHSRTKTPLPTSGIPDGTVLIEQVEEQKQWLFPSDKWLTTKSIINIAACEEFKYPERIALVLKQVKEEEPKAEQEFLEKLEELGINDTNIIEKLKEIYPKLRNSTEQENYTDYFVGRDGKKRGFNYTPKPASVEPEGEQTAEGIEQAETLTVTPKGADFEIIVQHEQSGSAYGITLSKNSYEQLRQHFAASQLAQYKAKLIRQLEEEALNLKKYNSHDFYDGASKAMNKAIEIIQTR